MSRRLLSWLPRPVLMGLWLVAGGLLLALTIRATAGADRIETVGAIEAERGGVASPIGADRIATASAPWLPPSPREWPKVLELGLADPPGNAAALAESEGFGIRYQYLSGGVNTGSGWRQYAPNGTFVDHYIGESIAAGLMPVFSYYMLLQSAPGKNLPDEREGDIANLGTRATMRAYFKDLEAFLRHAGRFAPQPVVLQVEPDLWGYIQQSARGDDAGTVGAQVSATGIPSLRGLPDNTSGLARAIVRLRNALAPNVILAYHLSVFGTGKDLLDEKPSLDFLDELAARSAHFYRSLHAKFDLIFAEYSNRNAGYSQVVLGDNGASWWQAADYERQVRYLAEVVRLSGRRVVLWQIPVGNTRMRAMDNSRFHYQDSHVQRLLGRDSKDHLRSYIRTGVVALLFGAALPGDTCACDAARDGVTNPAPINGNRIRSFGADDDGGYLRRRARLYVKRGPLRLPR